MGLLRRGESWLRLLWYEWLLVLILVSWLASIGMLSRLRHWVLSIRVRWTLCVLWWHGVWLHVVNLRWMSLWSDTAIILEIVILRQYLIELIRLRLIESEASWVILLRWRLTIKALTWMVHSGEVINEVNCRLGEPVSRKRVALIRILIMHA